MAKRMFCCLVATSRLGRRVRRNRFKLIISVPYQLDTDRENGLYINTVAFEVQCIMILSYNLNLDHIQCSMRQYWTPITSVLKGNSDNACIQIHLTWQRSLRTQWCLNQAANYNWRLFLVCGSATSPYLVRVVQSGRQLWLRKSTSWSDGLCSDSCESQDTDTLFTKIMNTTQTIHPPTFVSAVILVIMLSELRSRGFQAYGCESWTGRLTRCGKHRSSPIELDPDVSYMVHARRWFN